MSSFMDFNEDGKVDSGEEFTGHQIYRNVTGGQPPKVSSGGKLGWSGIIIIALIAYMVLSAIAGILYR